MTQLTPLQPNSGFDLFRLSKSKREVDLSPNTLRAYFKRGLPHFKMGKAIFISRAQLHQFITTHGAA
jgi:hypothetical protein